MSAAPSATYSSDQDLVISNPTFKPICSLASSVQSLQGMKDLKISDKTQPQSVFDSLQLTRSKDQMLPTMSFAFDKPLSLAASRTVSSESQQQAETAAPIQYDEFSLSKIFYGAQLPG
jgi:hypothetical protein